MEKLKNIEFERIIIVMTLIFLFIGLSWILIADNNLVGFILLGLGLVGVGFLFFFHLEQVKKFLKEFQWDVFTQKISYILIILGILVVVNLIASKRFFRTDLTSEGRFTLSDHTINLLKEIKKSEKKIKMIFFRSEVSMISTVEDLLKEYKARSSQIELEIVDPDRKPQMAKEYNVRSIGLPYGGQRLFGSVIILCNGLKEEVDVLKFDYRQVGGRVQPQLLLKENIEKDISSAILRVTKSKKKIYFSSGHGEVDLEDDEKTGWSTTKIKIADENYIIDKVYLPSLGKVPSDCDVLIIGAPQKNYSPREFEILDKYLDEGGHLLILLEPFVKADFNPLLNKWGIRTSNKFVVDPKSSYWFQPIIPLITEYSFHKITEKLKFATFFPTVTPVEILDKKPQGVDIQPIARTSDESWVESESRPKELKFNPGSDKKGPITIMVALEKKLDNNKDIRLVVIGDSDFASNYSISSYGNLDFLLNAINWVAGKEELIGIRSKTPQIREIMLTQQKINFILYTCVFILPALVIFAGVFIWWRRR
ncbi:MAG: Gldg family protein [Spirochaetes bacterium]|nr:Gldg family protein [Spirochaetota bacterium]